MQKGAALSLSLLHKTKVEDPGRELQRIQGSVMYSELVEVSSR